MTFAPLSNAAWTSFSNYLITTAATSSLAWFAEINCEIATPQLGELRAKDNHGALSSVWRRN
jgi:hypothetical protein